VCCRYWCCCRVWFPGWWAGHDHRCGSGRSPATPGSGRSGRPGSPQPASPTRPRWKYRRRRSRWCW